MRNKNRVLIIVQNLPVPLDRRVWLESQTLIRAGIGVSVICPQGPGDAHFQELDGARLYKYSPAPVTTGPLSFVYEFVMCWLKTFVLAWWVYYRDGFSVIQTCNPPDTYFALAAFFKPLGVRFVYDQHDLCPEVFQSRFGKTSGLFLQGLKLLERATYWLADQVIVTNESYRKVATGRGGVDPSDVMVVRSGPDSRRLYKEDEQPELRRGAKHLVCYLGVMGPQDDVNVMLDLAERVVRKYERSDIHFALLGFGDELESLQEEAHTRGLDPYVTFAGRVGDEEIRAYLSTASVGVAPDRKTALNDVSTHNKVMEYMTCELPVVGFDLVENSVSAGDAGIFVPDGDVDALAELVIALCDDPKKRKKLGHLGRERVENELAWEHQATPYLEVFQRAKS